jgi:hypothetical protein
MRSLLQAPGDTLDDNTRSRPDCLTLLIEIREGFQAMATASDHRDLGERAK